MLTSVIVSSATASVELDGFDTAGYTDFMIVMSNVDLSGNYALNMQVKSGGTHQTSGYQFAGRYTMADGTAADVASTSSTSIPVTANLTANTNGEMNVGAKIHCAAPYAASSRNGFKLSSTFWAFSSPSNLYSDAELSGTWSNTAQVTGVRFLPTSGNIEKGNFYLFGLRA
jgi:hypothetical protein